MFRSSTVSILPMLAVAIILVCSINNNNLSVQAAAAAASLAPPPPLAPTFDQYVQRFDKVYSSAEERNKRKAIFEANYQSILEHNNNKANGYWMDWNEWTDHKIPDELPLGYVKKSSSSAALFAEETVNFVAQKSSEEAHAFLDYWMNHHVVPVSELPTQVDWRTHSKPQVTTAVKQQGFCGSCWAVAAASVLESHIALTTGHLYNLSAQEMVSCVQNKQHCGGKGGCGGATYELAFEYVMQHGIVSEQDFPYKSATGRSVQCSLKNSSNVSPILLLRGGTSNDKDNNKNNKRDAVATNTNGYIDGAVATVQGYVNFPTNNYTVLMNAVATLGPIGVTVAASEWAFYSSGVFSSGNHNTTRATDVNHAVVLEGYGVDQETQEPYWLVRNSWGKHWGEGGYIRLKRVDPSDSSSSKDWEQINCGVDMKPADGAGCTKDKDGNTIVPPPVKVCGTSAILYDTFVPFGGRLLQQHTSIGGTEELQMM